MNQIATIKPSQGLIPTNFSEAMQLAEMMARGKMMPEHLKNPGDALMVVEQAMRWQMSPFAVAQATFNIKGKLLFAGTLVAAAVENSGAIEGLFDYQFSGEGPARTITVSATRRGEAEPRTVIVALKDARTENGMWTKQPDQQLVYHGARVWARRWTPGVMLGVYCPEEWTQQADPPFDGVTIDAAAPAKFSAPSMPTLEEAPRPPDPVFTIRERLAACEDAACVLRVGDAWRRTLEKAAAAGRPMPEAVVSVVADMLADRYGFFQGGDAGATDEPGGEEA